MVTVKPSNKGPRRHRFKVVDFHRMGDAGILRPEKRVELVEGDIIDMPSIRSPHAWCVTRLVAFFVQAVGLGAIVWPQNPLRLSEFSEPRPDVALLRSDTDRNRLPMSSDTLLVVEVSDSTLGYDLRVKTPLYARAGVPELWGWDLNQDRVLVHQEPGPDGYAVVREVRGNEPLSPQAFPDISLTPSQIFGGLH